MTDRVARIVAPLGRLALFCLLLQAATGIWMAFGYQPTPDHAYPSVYHLARLAQYGWAVRTVHHWGARLAVVLVVVHGTCAFAAASYKRPGQGAWSVGALAFLSMLALGLTGYLLPWDRAAFGGTEAAMRLLGSTPLVGGWAVRVMLGGDSVGAPALTRFYAAHAMLLPALLFGLLVAHRALSRAGRPARGPEGKPAGDAYRDRIARGATAVVLLLCVYAVLAIFLPAPLGIIADPAAAAAVTRPAWVLLFPYALSLALPSSVAMSVSLALGALIVLLPFLDRGPARAPRDRVPLLAAGLLAVAAIVVLTLVGAVS